MITIDNFEAYLLDKAEGNLNEEQLKELETFLSQHSHLIADSEEYDNSLKVTDYVENTCLYQQELIKKTIVFPAFRKVIMVAAVVSLLVVGYFFVKIYNNSTSVQTNNNLAKQENKTTENINNSSTYDIAETNEKQTYIKQSSILAKQRDRKIKQSSNETEQSSISSQYSPMDIEQEENAQELFAMETNLIDYKTTKETKPVEVENNNLIEYKKQKSFDIILPKRCLSIDLVNTNIAKK